MSPASAGTTGCMALTPEEAYAKARRYRTYWKKEGGITVSGGEPLLQMEFVTELFTRAEYPVENGVLTLKTDGARTWFLELDAK